MKTGDGDGRRQPCYIAFMNTFGERLAVRVTEVGSPICVGLDPHLERLPLPLQGLPPWVAAEKFCLGVIDEAASLAAAVKPQVAFFEALGWRGVAALETVVAAARSRGLLVILDAKRGDIGSTARAYVRGTLADEGPLGADAVTLSPYLGEESLQPFVETCDSGKGLFVLVRTSNPGSLSWQEPVAPRIAEWIRAQNEQFGADLGPIGAVVGATIPEGGGPWREALPRGWFLIPGYGAQGATADDLVAFFRPDGLGGLVNASRGVLFGAEPEDESWSVKVRERILEFHRDIRRVSSGA